MSPTTAGSAPTPGRRAARVLVEAAIVASLVAACGSSSATSAPSPSDAAAGLPTPIQVTAAPTTTPDIGPTSAPTGGPSGSPGPRPSPTIAPTPRPTPARDLALEASLPSEFEGMPIDRTSAVVTDAAAAAQGAAFKPVLDFIAGLGLQPHDLSQAAGQPADRSKGYQFIAYRFKGATEPDMLPAFLAALADAGVAKTTGSADLGGRRVRTLTSDAFAGPLEGAVQYMYQAGDTIYGAIALDEALAARMLKVLP
jgi:hypothetical protein